MFIQSHNHSSKSPTFVSYPHVTLLSACSKKATLLSIDTSLKFHNVQQLKMDLREKKRVYTLE